MKEPFIDVVASAGAFSRQWLPPVELVKLEEDLDRYRAVLAADRPEELVECGTWRGASARWFAAHGLQVITVDITDNVERKGHNDEDIVWITGDSGSPEIADRVGDLVGDRRCMVVLDSDHKTKHVADEIALYGPFVSVGCHLVVEDGIVRWLNDPIFADGGPLEAVETLLVDNDEWERNTEVESMFSVSMHPAGWWRRVSTAPALA